MRWKWWDYLLIVLILIGLMVIGYGWWQKSRNSLPKVEYLAVNEEGKIVVVDVSGAVINPGVYELIGETRLKDALVAAGGLSASADREYVAKMMNLAEKVKDGDKIYIPFSGSSDSDGDVKGVAVSGRVNINTATVEELDKLVGVGSVRAQAIIDGRPYKTVEELVAKKILPESIVKKNLDSLTVY